MQNTEVSPISKMYPCHGTLLTYVRHAHLLPFGLEVVGLHEGSLILLFRYNILRLVTILQSGEPFATERVKQADHVWKPAMPDHTDFMQAVRRTDRANQNWNKLLEAAFYLPTWPGATRARREFDMLQNKKCMEVTKL